MGRFLGSSKPISQVIDLTVDFLKPIQVDPILPIKLQTVPLQLSLQVLGLLIKRINFAQQLLFLLSYSWIFESIKICQQLFQFFMYICKFALLFQQNCLLRGYLQQFFINYLLRSLIRILYLFQPFFLFFRSRLFPRSPLLEWIYNFIVHLFTPLNFLIYPSHLRCIGLLGPFSIELQSKISPFIIQVNAQFLNCIKCIFLLLLSLPKEPLCLLFNFLLLAFSLLNLSFELSLLITSRLYFFRQDITSIESSELPLQKIDLVSLFPLPPFSLLIHLPNLLHQLSYLRFTLLFTLFILFISSPWEPTQLTHSLLDTSSPLFLALCL